MENPITGEKFKDQETCVQSLLDSLREVKIKQFQAGEAETKLLAALDVMAGEPTKTKGTLKLKGLTHEATITRRENVSYPKPRGEDHPLEVILDSNLGSLLKPMVRVKFEESGQKIAKFLENAKEYEDGLNEQLLVTELEAVRSVAASKIAIEIKEVESKEED